MVKQHIAFAQRRENTPGRFAVGEGGIGGGNECPILERRPVDAVDLPQRRQVEQPRHLDDVTGVHVEFAQQQFQHALGHVVGDLESHRRTEPPARQFPFQRLQQVLVAVLFNLVVGVAGDAESVMLDDVHTREQHRQERGDQLLHRQVSDHRRVSFAALCTVAAFEFDEAINVVGHLDPGEVLTAVIGLLDGDRQVQTQPAHKWERVCRVDRQRRQHREHLLGEIGRQLVALSLIQIGPRDYIDAFLGQRRSHRIQKHPSMPRRNLLGLFADAGQLLARCQTVGRADRQPHLVAALKAGHPDHVELVEVGGEDRQELGALQ